MTIYVDNLRSWPGPAKNAQAARFFGNGKLSCHMTTDGKLAELLGFARRELKFPGSYLDTAGLPQHLHHFDLNESMRRLAIRRGAVEFDILDEMYPIDPAHRPACLLMLAATMELPDRICDMKAVRLCALCNTAICVNHSHPGVRLDDGRKEFLCFDCAIK